MYKSTAASQQFMERSGNFSTHGSRTGRNLLSGGECEVMTPTQRRDALVAKHKMLTDEMIQINLQRESAVTVRQKQAINSLKKTKGIEYKKLCDDIKNANDECGRYSKAVDLGHFLIEVMRERMTKPEWDMVSKEARRRFENQDNTQEKE